MRQGTSPCPTFEVFLISRRASPWGLPNHALRCRLFYAPINNFICASIFWLSAAQFADNGRLTNLRQKDNIERPYKLKDFSGVKKKDLPQRREFFSRYDQPADDE